MDELASRAAAAKYVFYSYSGGRDSTIALLSTYDRFIAAGKVIEVLYVDNGCEFPDLYCHILRVVRNIGAKLTVIKSEKNIITEYVAKGCFPDSIHRDCIEKLINHPMDVYMRSLCGDEDYVLVRGGKARQRTTVSGTKLYQAVKAKPHMIIYNPLFEIDAGAYRDVPTWAGYEAGFVRTACWNCPFQRPVQWEALKRNYPLLHQELRNMFASTAFKRHPGDGYLKYIERYWERQEGVAVQYV